jgi:ribosomal-protein-alanine N-acetyltransferase
MGCFLVPVYWRKGIGTECARLVLQLAFAFCGALWMRAACDERNVASEGVMQKCGMRRDKAMEKAGRRFYRISRSEWFRSVERNMQDG